MGEGTQVKTCRTCGGTWTRHSADDPGRPWGWYSLSVNVPQHLGKRGMHPFIWVGLYCSAACLAAGAAQVAEQEAVARLAYNADLPQMPACAGRRR